MLHIIMPVYREGPAMLAAVQRALSLGPARLSVIWGRSDADKVPGGDVWGALEAMQSASPALDMVDVYPPGRARQMNTGAAGSQEAVLLFLHADTELPAGLQAHIKGALATGRCWGRFDVRFDAPGWRFHLLAAMMNLRSALTGMCTGDQAIFVQRSVFEQIGGFPEQPLMEDIELSKRLKRISPPARIKTPVTTSARRWQQHGWARTVLLMWGMRWAYFCKVSPDRLANWYRHAR